MQRVEPIAHVLQAFPWNVLSFHLRPRLLQQHGCQALSSFWWMEHFFLLFFFSSTLALTGLMLVCTTSRLPFPECVTVMFGGSRPSTDWLPARRCVTLADEAQAKSSRWPAVDSSGPPWARALQKSRRWQLRRFLFSELTLEIKEQQFDLYCLERFYFRTGQL